MNFCVGSVGSVVVAFLIASFFLSADLAAQTPSAEPQFTAEDVKNAADLRSGGVAPGEVVVLLVPNAGPAEMVPWGLAANLAVAEPIGETRVYFDNVSVPIIHSVRGRIGTVVPLAVAGRKTTEVVVEYGGRRSTPVSANVVSSAPAVFTLDASGEGMLSPGRAAPEVSVTVGGVPAPILFTERFGSLQVNFRIPLRAPVGDAVPVVLTVRGRHSSAGVTMAVRSAKRRVVLLVDDPAVFATLRRILSSGGYDVVAAGADGTPPDLVIADLVAPQEEAGHLRETHPQLRIMALAANLDPATLREASMLGAQAVLTKPLLPAKVLRQVRAFLWKKTAVY